ncbi:thioredoxin family protein [Chitinibacteraceae bacterium HSL-7]
MSFMRLVSTVMATVLLPVAAHALDIKPYSAAELARLQAADQTVALHFHADWCPTCRTQAKVFDGWKNDASVPGTLLVVNYDDEKPLRKAQKVRTQSTLIVFKGSVEKARLAGDTDAAKLKAALMAGR